MVTATTTTVAAATTLNSNNQEPDDSTAMILAESSQYDIELEATRTMTNDLILSFDLSSSTAAEPTTTNSFATAAAAAAEAARVSETQRSDSGRDTYMISESNHMITPVPQIAIDDSKTATTSRVTREREGEGEGEGKGLSMHCSSHTMIAPLDDHQLAIRTVNVNYESSNHSNHTNHNNNYDAVKVESDSSFLQEQLQHIQKHELDHSSQQQPERQNQRQPEHEREREQNQTDMQHPFHQTTRSKRTNAFILIALCLSVFMSTFDTTVVATALPRLASDLHAMDTVSGVITAFLLAFSIGQPIFGKLSDIFGRKTMYLISLILFFIGSALCGASVTIVMLVAARAVQGLGASSLTNLAMIIIADIYSVREAGKYIGLICIVAAVGTVVGPLAGGALVDKLSWRWVFLIQLPFCLLPIILLAVFLRIPSTREHGSSAAIAPVSMSNSNISSKDGGSNDNSSANPTPVDQTNTRPSLRRSLRRVDFVGSLAFAAAISCILLATQWGGHEYSWSSSQIVGLYICGGILVCVFLCVETKWTQEPVVPLSMFRLRNVWLSSVMNVFVGALFFGLIFFIPIYFQAAMGDSATKSGTRLISYMASLCVVAAISGAIVAETGRYRVQIWFGSALTTVGSCLLLLWWKSDANATSPAMQICFPMITGIGLGMLVQTTITSTQSQLPLTDLAAGTSMANLLRTMGGTIGVAIKSAIVSNSLRTNILNSPGAGSIENIDNLVKIAVDGVGAIETLPPDQKAIVLAAYVKALHGAFLVFVPCAVIVFVGGLFLKHAVLSTSTTATTPTASGDSVDEVKV